MAKPGFDRWLAWVFDHPVSEDGWWWSGNAAGAWDPLGRPGVTVEYLTRIFAEPALLTRAYDPEQVGQGLYFIASNSCSNHLFALDADEVPWPAREACLRAIETLYRDLFARRCARRLSHLDRKRPDQPDWLQMTCYMLWDLVPFGGGADTPQAARKALVCLDVMEATLAIDHPACQEAALHGLGHGHARHPARVERAIDAFLARGRISPELRSYAEGARRGRVQ